MARRPEHPSETAGNRASACRSGSGPAAYSTVSRASCSHTGSGTTGYTENVAPERTVKITVSIPASLFDAADRLARRRGVPRSRLYAEALQRSVDEDSESDVTRQLDELAAEMDTSMDPVVRELQRRALARHGG
jgi:predicted transcriptional regulator